MAVSVGDIVAAFKFDTSGIEKGSKDAQASLTKIGTTSVATGTLISEMAMKAARSFADLAQAPIAAALAAGRYAESIDNMSHATGLSANQLQTYQVILNRTGLELTDLQVSFRTLATKMQEAQKPGSEAAKMFSELGIILTGAEGPAEMLDIVADKLKEMPDGFQKTATATDLLGRSGMKLIPALKDGSAAFTEAGESARLMGVIMGEEAREKAMKLDDAMDDLKLSQQALSNTVGTVLAPAMTIVVNGMTAGINKITSFIQRFDEVKDKSGSWAAGLAAAMAPLDKPGTVKKDGETLRIMPAPSDSDLAKMQEALNKSKESEAQMIKMKGLEDFVYSGQRLREYMPELTLVQAAEHARAQELAGQKIVLTGINSEHTKLAKSHAQEALGQAIVTKLLKDYKEEQIQLTNAMTEQVRVEELNQNFQARSNKGADEMLEKMLALQKLYPSLADGAYDWASAVRENESVAQAIIQQEQLQHQLAVERVADIQREIDISEANFTLQKAFYSQAPGIFGAADNVRRAAFDALELDVQRQIAVLDESKRRGEIIEQDYANRILQIDANTTARRIGIVQQYPDFWQQQLQAIVSSNAFSMAQIINQSSGAFAQWVVQGTSFQQFWVNLQTTLLQAVVNMGVQQLAQIALLHTQELALSAQKKAQELGLIQATEATKQAITTESAVAQIAQQKAVGMATVAAAGTTLASVSAVGEASLGTLAAVTVAVVGYFEAMAAALAASVFGAPMAPGFAAAGAAAGVAGTAAVTAGQAALTGAVGAASGVLAASLATPFAEGGIVTKATLGLVGEAGPEAIIPLRDAGMLGGGGPMNITFEMDGRTMSELVMRYMPGSYYYKVKHA